MNTKIILILWIFFFLFLISKKDHKIRPITHKKRRPTDIFYNKVLIEAHHDANNEIFEHTMESFSKEIDYDIDCLETDIWLTKDKVLVLVYGCGMWAI